MSLGGRVLCLGGFYGRLYGGDSAELLVVAAVQRRRTPLHV